MRPAYEIELLGVFLRWFLHFDRLPLLHQRKNLFPSRIHYVHEDAVQIFFSRKEISGPVFQLPQDFHRHGPDARRASPSQDDGDGYRYDDEEAPDFIADTEEVGRQASPSSSRKSRSRKSSFFPMNVNFTSASFVCLLTDCPSRYFAMEFTDS